MNPNSRVPHLAKTRANVVRSDNLLVLPIQKVLLLFAWLHCFRNVESLGGGTSKRT